MTKAPQDMKEGTVHNTNKCGKISILEYHSKLKVKVSFIETGFNVITCSKSIRSGSVKDKLSPSVYGVGFIGVGKYTSSKKGPDLKAYTTWTGMLERCYSENLRYKNPTYADCSVCEYWHNFQNFAEWFYCNYKKDLELDKDIRLDGNKIYSPDSCLFVTKAENMAKAGAKNYTLTSPLGVKTDIYNLAEFCRKNKLDHSGVWKVMKGKSGHCKGWTI